LVLLGAQLCEERGKECQHAFIGRRTTSEVDSKDSLSELGEAASSTFCALSQKKSKQISFVAKSIM
jgi:hypothetical protein